MGKTREMKAVKRDLHNRAMHLQKCAALLFSSAKWINTSYLTDSYISFTLKLESGQIFCSNRSIRSSTYGKKNIYEIPPCGSHFLKFILPTSFEENHKFINKNDQLPAWRKIGNIFFTVCIWPNWPVRANILSGFQIEGKTYVWISQVRRVKEVTNPL